MKLRPYQERIATDAADIITRKMIVCLFMEVRTGKTATALHVCKLSNFKKVLFITKLKAIDSIGKDYLDFGYLGNFELEVINRESLHKITSNDFDCVIIDEVHSYASYPKPSKYFKDVNSRFGDLPMIMLSGTPSPESYSQYYHIFALSNHSPFKEYKNFYKWAADYVNVKVRHLGYAKVNDYSDARKIDFWHHIRYHILTFTQKEANFITNVKENLLQFEPADLPKRMIKRLCNDLVLVGKSGKEILADTAVKLQQKVHQIENGTIIFEDGTSAILDYSKGLFIREKFKGQKIAIFYYYRKEWDLLKEVFGDNLTNDLNEFNTTSKCIALQQISGAEGISLKEADALIFYNWGFSNVKYVQAKDRLTTMDRKENTVYFILAKGGINEKVYKSLQKKEDYVSSIFIKEYGIKIPNKADTPIRKTRV